VLKISLVLSVLATASICINICQSAFSFCPRRCIIGPCDCSYAFSVLHFNQSCLCTGSQPTCHFIFPSERSPLSLILLYTGAAIHFNVSAIPLDCNTGKKKVQNVQPQRKTGRRKKRRQSKGRTKFEKYFLLYLARQSPLYLQRKPAHGRRLVLPPGEWPTFPCCAAGPHTGQAHFQNLLHARSNTGKKYRGKAVLADVIQPKASAGYFSLSQIC